MPSFVRFGLILTAVGVLVNILGWATGTDTGMVAGVWSLLAIVGSVVILVMGIKAHRTETAGADGDYTFMQAFVEGLKMYGVSFVAGLIWNYVFFSFINTDFVERQKVAMTEMFEKMGAPEETVNQSLAELDKSPLELVLNPGSLITIAVIGVVLCVILAAILKRERKFD